MNLAVSNIAWANEEEAEIASLLKKLDVKNIELAPTKQWHDPTKATSTEIKDYASFWVEQGLEIVALQSMLYNRPDLKIFESPKKRQETLDYLSKFIEVAKVLGAKVMVFGSPKNRQKGTIDSQETIAIAKDFFGQVGEVAETNDVFFCLEPNPPAYGCDFITNTREAIDFIKILNKSSIRLHLDPAVMTLNGEDITRSINQAAPFLQHFHISAPYLESVEPGPKVDYAGAIKALKEIDYKGMVSIEMRPSQTDQNKLRVEKAVKFAQSLLTSLW